MVNILTRAQELIRYLDDILALHLTPKSKELGRDVTTAAKVFIGHGRNQVVRERVEDFIHKGCGPDLIVLEDQPSEGMTVIEKLEKHGRLADYAVLILTGDDVSAEGLARARQNVIQELGWFQGVLGRKRTAMLVERGVDIPSNVAGVVRLNSRAMELNQRLQSSQASFERRV